MEDREERREARGWMPRTGPGTSSLSGHCWQESHRGHTRPTPRHRATAAQRFRLRGEPPSRPGSERHLDPSSLHTPSLLLPERPPEKGEACKEGRHQPRPLTTQRRDASHVTAARVPCGELQSHPHSRRPFQLVHQGQEDLGWHWDLQGEQPGGGRSSDERLRGDCWKAGAAPSPAANFSLQDGEGGRPLGRRGTQQSAGS